jgi:NDP-sugar pyrophosphorylase family protein
MQALILAGGQGTRLRPLTINIPKPNVPIGNQPFLLRQIQSLKSAGITDITLSTGYQPSAIEKALGDGSEFGVNLRYLVEPVAMGTAGAYKFAERFLETTTVVLNGDILTDIDLRGVIERHKKHNAAATIVLTEVENPSVYGVVEIDEDQRVLRFLEKPKPDDISNININTINAGIYILEPQILGTMLFTSRTRLRLTISLA